MLNHVTNMFAFEAFSIFSLAARSFLGRVAFDFDKISHSLAPSVFDMTAAYKAHKFRGCYFESVILLEGNSLAFVKHEWMSIFIRGEAKSPFTLSPSQFHFPIVVRYFIAVVCVCLRKLRKEFNLLDG
jgi:hypothetical protein